MDKSQMLIRRHEESLNVAVQAGNKKEELKVYGDLGSAYFSQRQFHKSIKCYEKYLQIGKQLNQRQSEGYACCRIGVAYQYMGDYPTAIKYHEESRRIAMEVGDLNTAGSAICNLGVTYGSQGRYDKAIECYHKSLEIATEIGDKEIESNTCCNIGTAYQSIGKYDLAIKYYKDSLNIAVQMADRTGEMGAYGSLGNAYSLVGKFYEAIKYSEYCLEMAREIGDKRAEAGTNCNIGNAYNSLGKYRQAIQYHEKCLTIATEIRDKRCEGLANGNLGNAYSSLGQYEEAITFHQKQLLLAKEMGNKSGEAIANCNLGIAFHSLEKYREATEHYEESLSIAIKMRHKHGQAKVYNNLGNTKMSVGKYREAIECYEKSLNIATEIGDVRGRGGACLGVGECYYRLSYHSKHCKCDEYNHQRALAKSQEFLKLSLLYYERVFDNLREKDQFKVSIVDTFVRGYKMLTAVHIEAGQFQEAFLVSERGRARALDDLLAAKYNMTKETPSNTIKIQEYDDVENLLTCESSILVFAHLSKKFTTKKYDLIATWVLTVDKPLFFLTSQLDQVDLLKAYQDQREHKAGTKYIEKLVDEAYKKLQVREVAANCEDRSMETSDVTSFEEAEGRSGKRCIAAEDLEEENEPLKSLYEVLLTPLLHTLTQDEIVIVPDGPLYRVPFAALKDPITEKYLSETKRIRLAPSLTTLQILKESSADYHSMSGALIVGDPDVGEVVFKGKKKVFSRLPDAKLEAERISNILGVSSMAITGRQATKQVVKEKLQEGVAVVHFAAHGSTDGEIALAPPAIPGIPQEEDYLLTMKEVQEIGVKAQLVVLSCCHSGRGEIKAEGVVGMSRAFLAAGARAVVASLWAIDDEATRVFMEKFYTHLKERESASESLVQAMREMREGKYSKPMFWAPFFLIGDNVTVKL